MSIKTWAPAFFARRFVGDEKGAARIRRLEIAAAPKKKRGAISAPPPKKTKPAPPRLAFPTGAPPVKLMGESPASMTLTTCGALGTYSRVTSRPCLANVLASAATHKALLTPLMAG